MRAELCVQTSCHGGDPPWGNGWHRHQPLPLSGAPSPGNRSGLGLYYAEIIDAWVKKVGKSKVERKGGGIMYGKNWLHGWSSDHPCPLACCMVNSNKNSVKGAKSVPGSSSAPCQGADQQRNLRQTRSQIQLLTSDMFNCGIPNCIGGGAN